MAGVSRYSVLREYPELVPRDINMHMLQRIRKLVGEGMAESAAREEVLGKGWVEP
jgi:hypothetical protein